jgi:tetratricopeptide (TPR) repeat protein
VIHTDDPTFAFILMDRHFLKKDFDKALKTVRLLMGDLGRDAFLSALEASCLSELGRNKDAVDAADAGLKMEEGDRQLLWTKVSLFAKSKQYPELTEVLGEILQRHNQFADPKKAELAGLTGYFESAEGLAYVARLNKLGHIKTKEN